MPMRFASISLILTLILAASAVQAAVVRSVLGAEYTAIEPAGPHVETGTFRVAVIAEAECARRNRECGKTCDAKYSKGPAMSPPPWRGGGRPVVATRAG
jgi:hypothetical protein